MTAFVEKIVSAFIVIGGVFLFVGSFGLAHPIRCGPTRPTKATTLASLRSSPPCSTCIYASGTGLHELLSHYSVSDGPVTAKMIAKAHIFRNNRCKRRCLCRRRVKQGDARKSITSKEPIQA